MPRTAASLVTAIQLLVARDLCARQGAPPADEFPHALPTAAAVAARGLEFHVDLLTRSTSPVSARRCGSFETLGDVTAQLRWHNAGEAVADLLLDGDVFGMTALTALLEADLRRDDGTSVPLPSCVPGCTASPSWSSLAGHAALRRLAPSEWVMRSFPLTEWIGVGQVALPPGIYRLRVAYLGRDPARFAEHRSDDARSRLLASAWHGRAWSSELRFRITGPQGLSEWSAARDGLRAAVQVRPLEHRLFNDEMAHPRVLVENVSKEPIRWFRPIAASQEDRVTVRSDDADVQHGSMWASGYYETFEWTLAPGRRVWIEVAPVRFTGEGWQAGNSSGNAAPLLGRIEVDYHLTMTDCWLPPGAPRPYRNELAVPTFALELLSRAK